jgi:hypothetical protein
VAELEAWFSEELAAVCVNLKKQVIERDAAQATRGLVFKKATGRGQRQRKNKSTHPPACAIQQSPFLHI